MCRRRHCEPKGNLWEHIGNDVGERPASHEKPPTEKQTSRANAWIIELDKAVDACACEEINRFQSNGTQDQLQIQRRCVPRLPPHPCMLASRFLVPEGIFVFLFLFGVAAFGGAASKQGKQARWASSVVSDFWIFGDSHRLLSINHLRVFGLEAIICGALSEWFVADFECSVIVELRVCIFLMQDAVG